MKHRRGMDKLIVHSVLSLWEAHLKGLIGWETTVRVLSEIVEGFGIVFRGNRWRVRGKRTLIERD